jgi:hypothetical protein
VRGLFSPPRKILADEHRTVTGRNAQRGVLDNHKPEEATMSTSIDPCRELKAKLNEIEASIKRLNQEREDIIDDIQDIYCAWEDVHDERYQLPH